MEKLFTLTIFTENKVGLVSRLAIIFTRRKINIESLTTSETETEDVYRFTICVKTTPDMIQKVAKQIEKQIEVLRCFYYEDDEIVFQELALYKVSIQALQDNHGSSNLERVVRNNHARILTVLPECVVIEKSGHEEEIQKLFHELVPFKILGFVRSGRIAVAKRTLDLSFLVQELDKKNVEILEEQF
ncbi:MAG: acetolactate synthase small subunit [Flammeovirgaceae bacterium]|nr:acetolactate synthase small subunit [Flammeovirgaceae bacterium]